MILQATLLRVVTRSGCHATVDMHRTSGIVDPVRDTTRGSNDMCAQTILTRCPVLLGGSRERVSVRARAVLKCCLCLCFMSLVGCTVQLTSTQWIEAPIVADGSLVAGSTYVSDNQAGGLHVSASDVAYVKFSLATLPAGSTPTFSVPDSTATITSTNYPLTADKVAHARVVLYVDHVQTPGRIRISALAWSPHGIAVDCWPSEASPPRCLQEGVSGTGMDADNPTQELYVRAPGFYTFDVTAATKQWIGTLATAGLPNSGIEISSVQNDDGSYGDFTFVSKETAVGQTSVRHDAALLVTLDDAVGFSMSAVNNTSVKEDAPTINFSAAPDLTLNGTTGQRAYALEDLGPVNHTFALWTIIQDGALLKTSIVSYVNAQPADTQTIAPEMRVYRTAAFDASSLTWNTWSPPSGSTAPVAVAPLRADLGNQVPIVDIGHDYAQIVADTFNADPGNSSLPHYYASATTNSLAPITLDALATSGVVTGHQPRVIGAYRPGPGNQSNFGRGKLFVDFHDDDSMWSLCVVSSQSGCPSQGTMPALRARIGQAFPDFFVNVSRPLVSTSHIALYIPVSLRNPDAGAAAIFPTMDLAADNISAPLGVPIGGAKANRNVGAYTVSASVPGHNFRLDIPFENLPLPTPTLAGPAEVNIPSGQTAVTSSAFTLGVTDPVNDNIDDTTKWD
ncbi:MAG: hypothetical protein ABI748_14320, partial [Dokdonella sp.]